MLLIHTADLHLGAGLARMPESLREVRLRDFLSNLETIADFAVRNRADFVVIAGDVFERTHPASDVFDSFAAVLSRLLSAGVRVIIVAGNHDVPKLRTRPPYLRALERIASAHRPDSLIFATEPSVVTLSTRDGRKVAFILMPYSYPEDKASFVASVRSTFRALRERAEESDPDFIVCVAHLLVEGAKTHGAVYKLDIPVPLSCISDSSVSYVALGHVHTYQELSRRAVYSGSIERVSFAEEEDEKFFVVVREEGGDLAHEAVRLKTRPLVTLPSERWGVPQLDLTVHSALDVTDLLLKLLRSAVIPRGAIVRLRYRLRRSQFVRGEKLARFFEARGVLYWFEEPEVVADAPRSHREETTRVLPTIYDLLEEYVRNLLLDEETRRLVIEKALELMRQVQGE